MTSESFIVLHNTCIGFSPKNHEGYGIAYLLINVLRTFNTKYVFYSFNNKHSITKLKKNRDKYLNE